MDITNYLPTPSEYSTKVGAIFAPYTTKLYAVGSNARKFLYQLSTTPADYDFVLSTSNYQDILLMDIQEAFPGKVVDSGHFITVDCEVFTLKLTIKPIDEWLRTVPFSGDGLAVYVPDGRPICIPEYMTLPPGIPLTDPAKLDEKWVINHIQSLNKFQDEMLKQIEKNLADEPSKTKGS